jgi:hypothetical protein
MYSIDPFEMLYSYMLFLQIIIIIIHTPFKIHNTVRSESRCAFRLRYVDLVVSIEVSVEVCYCVTVFSC